MIEQMLLIIFIITCGWLVCVLVDAVRYARDVSYQPPAELKWAINPRAMRWLIPLIGASVCAYVGYLKILGLI